MSEEKIDKILNFLIDKVEETGIGSSLTIIINGAIITGDLIKSDSYYDKMIEIYQSIDKTNFDSTVTPQNRQIFEDFRHEYINMIRQLKHEPENEARHYIHLKNVIIRNAGIFTPARALVWRSKLSSVDGFSIGITEFQIPEIPSVGGLDISRVINQFANASNPVNRTD